MNLVTRLTNLLHTPILPVRRVRFIRKVKYNKDSDIISKIGTAGPVDHERVMSRLIETWAHRSSL